MAKRYLNVVFDMVKDDVEEEKLSFTTQDDSYQEFCVSEYDKGYYTIIDSKDNLEVIVIYKQKVKTSDIYDTFINDVVNTIVYSYSIPGMYEDDIRKKVNTTIVFNLKIENIVLPLKEFFTINDDTLDLLKNTNVKKWYHAYRKDDEEYKRLNNKATFYDMLCFLNCYGYEFNYNDEDIDNINYYDIFGIDCSDIREVFFAFLSDTINCDYDLIYDLWLDNEKALYHFTDKDNNLLLDFNLDLLDYARQGAAL